MFNLVWLLEVKYGNRFFPNVNVYALNEYSHVVLLKIHVLF